MSTEPSNLNSKQDVPDTKSESIVSSFKCSSEDCVRDYPVSSVMLTVGAGAAIGLILAAAIGRRDEAKRSGYISNLASQIASSLGDFVPESLRRHR